jgi:hypothetical protein
MSITKMTQVLYGEIFKTIFKGKKEILKDGEIVHAFDWDTSNKRKIQIIAN